MPVILDDGNFDDWLNPLGSVPINLMKPAPAGELSCTPVSRALGNPRKRRLRFAESMMDHRAVAQTHKFGMLNPAQLY